VKRRDSKKRYKLSRRRKQVSRLTNPGQPGKVLDKTEQREMRSAKKVGFKNQRSSEEKLLLEPQMVPIE